MSDLIDFDTPNTNNASPALALPLIPAPESVRSDASSSINEAGRPIFSLNDEKRRSMENNPFDMVMKKITEYERNKEDPFERVTMGFSGRMSIESKDDLLLMPRRRKSDVFKLNKTIDETENNVDLSMSILTDLNNTNLIECSEIDGKKVIELWRCDNKTTTVPNVNISPSECDLNLSILNTSTLNDSLLENKDEELTTRPRSMSQSTFLIPSEMPKSSIRSLSVTDSIKNNGFNEDSSVKSNIFEEPLNNAFRQISNSSSSVCNLSNRLERLNSDSSVFSGMSNISAIPMDSSNKIKRERFCSDSSVFSSISNVSIIPQTSTVSSCDSSVFSNDTINKGFVASKSLLNSTSSTSALSKTPLKTADKSDLFKKFFEIKTRMSTSQMDLHKCYNDTSIEKSEPLSSGQLFTSKECVQRPDEKLIDVDPDVNYALNRETGVKSIISHEANALAEKIEQMASINKDSQSTTQDDLFFSKVELNFDDLPPSDDEDEDNLIDLPSSPISKVQPEIEIKIETVPESSQNSPKDNIKELENEFIEQKDPDKKAVAATLLLDLKKIVKEDNNPDACKILDDLQKMLGVKCSSNTEILQMCLDNDYSQTKEKSELKSNLKESVPEEQSKCNGLEKQNQDMNERKLSEAKKDKKKQSISDSDLKVEDNIKKEVDSMEDSPEDQKLAIDLLHALKNIASDKSEDSAIDVLKSLGTVLSMATELRTKSKVKQIAVPDQTGRNVTTKLNRSISSLYKSSSKSQDKLQNKSLEPLPALRRSISASPARNKNLLELPLPKDKRRSHLLSIKKHFPSNPGFVESENDKKNKSPATKKKSPLSTSPNTKTEPIKTKLKKTSAKETVARKGPLKAIIPLGNMQKRASSVLKLSNNSQVTPPKTVASISTLKIISSTPNPNETRKNAKSNPTASSTPNTATVRYRHSFHNQTTSSKNTLSTSNLSPVSLNKVNGSVKGVKRTERTMSPQSKPPTPKKNVENGGETKLPRYSPRPVRVRNVSFSEVKNVKSPLHPSLMPKGSSEKRIQRNSVSSPLRNCNNVAFKFNPLNLVSRLAKGNTIQTGPEKENFA